MSRSARVVAVVLLLILLSPVIGLLSMQIPFIYNWEFDRIAAKLQQYPDVKITDTWKHTDTTLEDFGFTLQVRNCPPIRLNYYEGGDWDRDFGVIDGLEFTKPYNPATNDYESVVFSTAELAGAGIHISSLQDVFAKLEHLLTYLEKHRSHPQPFDRLKNSMRIFYDLDAYKTPGPGV